jgi:hypothetical protein
MLRFKFGLMGLTQPWVDQEWSLHNNAVSPYLLLFHHKLTGVIKKEGPSAG